MPRLTTLTLTFILSLLIFTLLALAFSLLVHAEVTIAIDLRPGSDVNPVNARSQGSVPVALLCNAVSNPKNIRQETITLCAPGKTCAPNAEHCHFDDVNTDGCDDLVCHFPVPSLQLDCDETLVVLTAVWAAGADLMATDNVTIVGPCP